MIGFDSQVSSRLAQLFQTEHEGRKVAVFDADGTLWRGDIGEAFFRHQVEKKTIPGAPPKDAWNTYLKESLEGDATVAYAWLAQWNAGVFEHDLKVWCQEFFEDVWTGNIFEPVKQLTQKLKSEDFEVWVVTGSPRWIVQAGVKNYDIDVDRVIGTNVVVENGVLTERLQNEVPYRAGKARLIEKIIGTEPLFAAGNTFWDKEMLTMARGLSLAICSEGQHEPNFESEQKLQNIARENGWLRQQF